MAEGLRLTLLAYNYVDASLDWRQPRHLNLQTPRRRPDSLRRNWADQHEVWEFPQASN